MDLTPFLKALEEHTKALFTHSQSIEKMIALGSNSPKTEADPATPRPRGRPPKGETVQTAQTGAVVADAAVSTPVVAASTTTVVAGSATQTPTTVTATSGKLAARDLVPAFKAYAAKFGRDKVVALIGEFGVTELGKVPAESLQLLKDRLEGKPQTPVTASDTDMSDLLGLAS